VQTYDVFISYATEDEAYAEKVANSLKSLGFKIWFAPATLKVGDSLLSSINAGLSASKYGLLILSAEYMSKSWTEYELNVLHRQYMNPRDSKNSLLSPHMPHLLWHMK
jgi:hypothetical protein